MAIYPHGIYVNEQSTVMPVSNTATAGITCVVGTAPVNMLANPAAAVLAPIELNDISDVQSQLGYSSNVDKYTIMQAVHSFFEVFGIAPLVAINVLDPTKHTTTGKTASGALSGGSYTFTDAGILLSEFVLKSGDGLITYVAGTDYTAAFNSDGTLTVTRVAAGEIPAANSEIEATYSVLDPTKVTDADIIAGVAAINRVYPALGINPETLIAPGYSQNNDVSTALIAAAANVSSVFKATAVCDIDSAANKTISAAITAKATQGLATRNVIACYPKVMTTVGKTIWQSAQLAALMQYTDSNNESSPFVSPSNKTYNVVAAVLADGTQVNYTPDEANQLNGEGIFTALRMEGWKSWGNNTGIYSLSAGGTYDVKDRYINIKRGFDWQANRFIRDYFAKIDSPLNYRAIQTLITDENQFYNGFIAAGLVAGMSMEYNQADNPTSSLLNGAITFTQYLSPYTPLEVITNNLQYDVSMLQTALEGGSES